MKTVFVNRSMYDIRTNGIVQGKSRYKFCLQNFNTPNSISESSFDEIFNSIFNE